MDKNKIFQFIAKQKTAFIASVNEQGYPVIRAMLAPRKIEGNEIYFSTNTFNIFSRRNIRIIFIFINFVRI